MSNTFEIIGTRFNLKNSEWFLVQGWFSNNKCNDVKIKAVLDGIQLEVNVEERSGVEILEKNLNGDFFIDTEYYAWIKLPSDFADKRSLTIYTVESEQKTIVRSIKTEWITSKNKNFCGYIDSIEWQADSGMITGWAASSHPMSIRVLSSDHSEINASVKRTSRRNVIMEFPELDEEDIYSFEIKLPSLYEKQVILQITTENKKYSKLCKFAVTDIEKNIKTAEELTKKCSAYYKKKGILKTAKKALEKVIEGSSKDYNIWIREHMPTALELKNQEKHKFKYSPKISIVIPLYKTPVNYLDELVSSIRRQTYSNWEICFSDGSGENSPLTDILKKYQDRDDRIKTVYTGRQMQISENTNCALDIADGDYIMFTDHDDIITRDALFEFVKIINENENVDIIYSDEDKVTMDGRQFFEPHFKPDYNLDLLNSTNYFCHLVAVKADIARQAGLLNHEFDGAQDYDFVLRCTEISKDIYHIPKILYHWRAHKDSTAKDPESKSYAFEAGMRAVAAHYERIGVKAEVLRTQCPGIYRTKYIMDSQPLVSIIIPNKDHIDDLEKCINSIEQKSKYPNIEYIIIENNSTAQETFKYYEELKEKNSRVKVITWNDEFNYSAINNFGERAAVGEYLLFLNNDTEIINEDCIEELLSFCMRDEVGAVGARLFYPDNTIQHAGVVMKLGGVAGHISSGQPGGILGYFARVICAQDFSAVTAACLMTKRSVFEEVLGFNEELKVAFNDVDFCLKIGKLGKLVVYNPNATLYHYESKSRGAEDTKEKKERFDRETEYMYKSWSDILINGDPNYNPNLTLKKGDYSLRK